MTPSGLSHSLRNTHILYQGTWAWVPPPHPRQFLGMAHLEREHMMVPVLEPLPSPGDTWSYWLLAAAGIREWTWSYKILPLSFVLVPSLSCVSFSFLKTAVCSVRFVVVVFITHSQGAYVSVLWCLYNWWLLLTTDSREGESSGVFTPRSVSVIWMRAVNSN